MRCRDNSGLSFFGCCAVLQCGICSSTCGSCRGFVVVGCGIGCVHDRWQQTERTKLVVRSTHSEHVMHGWRRHDSAEWCLRILHAVCEVQKWRCRVQCDVAECGCFAECGMVSVEERQSAVGATSLFQNIFVEVEWMEQNFFVLRLIFRYFLLFLDCLQSRRLTGRLPMLRGLPHDHDVKTKHEENERVSVCLPLFACLRPDRRSEIRSEIQQMTNSSIAAKKAEGDLEP